MRAVKLRARFSFIRLFVAVIVAVVGAVGGVKEAPCTSAYSYLAGCLTFVSGPDAIPNPICCGGVSHLNDYDPHCLCTIIQNLGHNPNVNFTKACVLPLQCNIPVDVVECPTLMLPPGYPLPPSLPPTPHHDALESAAAQQAPPSSALLALLFSLLFSLHLVTSMSSLGLCISQQLGTNPIVVYR